MRGPSGPCLTRRCARRAKHRDGVSFQVTVGRTLLSARRYSGRTRVSALPEKVTNSCDRLLRSAEGPPEVNEARRAAGRVRGESSWKREYGAAAAHQLPRF